MKIRYITLYLNLFIILSVNIFAQTNINVLPSVNVEVGKAVYFDAMYYRNTIADTIQCEWDFGDGYRLYADSDGDPFETGMCVVHYFMSPGNFKVKLTVSSFDMSKRPPTRGALLASDSVVINVTGEAPLQGFELWHAPFHARTAQYLYAKVPQGYNPSQVVAKVERIGGGFSQELIGTTVDDKQRFLLNNSSLPSGNYVVIAELKNGETVVSRIKEKFSKPYDGAPEVGINENNAFVLNGTTLFFPLSPFMLNKGEIPLWKKVSNTLHTVGYYQEQTKETWVDYINKGYSDGMLTIGPGRGTYFNTKTYYARNSDVNDLVSYVSYGKNTSGLLGWCWDDEPNLGGRYAQVPAAVLAGWSYRNNLEDPHHPSAIQFYGFDWMPHYQPRKYTHPYSFMRCETHFGGKKTFIADFFTHDVYPIEDKEHVTLNYSDRGVVDLWLENLDHFNWNMAGLAPLGAFIEPQNVVSFERMSGYDSLWDAGPTPTDVRTEAWGAIIHGMKYVAYFQFYAQTPAGNLSALGELKEAVTALTPVILAPPSNRTMSHNCNTRGNRVDMMIREYGPDVYVFAARITEPESEWNEVYEPEVINFQLNTGLNCNLAYDELEKYRWKYLKFDATSGQQTFNFTVPEGGIVPGTLLISAVKKSAKDVNSNYPDSLYDRWTGKGYPTEYDIAGNLRYGFDDGNGNIVPLYSWDNVSGTINYNTGQVQLNFTNGIPEGKGFVQVTYAPANRQARAIPMSGGILNDTLERNAVRIYRFPNTSGVNVGENLINRFKLHQNYPNPFNPKTKITYAVGGQGHISLKIYDLLGREIVTLVNEVKSPGEYTVEWDGTNSKGQQVASGVYFYQLKTSNGYINTKKMILLK